MTTDARTVAVYDAHADSYADRFRTSAPDAALQGFMDALPAGSKVLDLGCGPANASAFMRAAGLRPDPVDAARGMVALANKRHDVGARLATFDDINGVAVYDGIWANFSLLHAARADLPRHLASLRNALRSGGILHIAMKTGTGEGRDSLERFYTYVTRDELLDLLAEAGFTVTATEEGEDTGLAGTCDPFIICRAHV